MLNQHRQKLRSLFDTSTDAVIYVKGASVMHRYGTDFEFPFRQESNFLYLTGVNEPDFSMMIDLKRGNYHLFSPRRDTQFAVWHGRIVSQNDLSIQYEPDEIHYTDELETIFKKINPNLVYCLSDHQASDIQAMGFSTNTDTLLDALTDCRVIKSEWELEKMRFANKVTSEAHSAMLTEISPGKTEGDLKATFDFIGGKYGLFQDAYSGIFGSGPNSAILHYVEKGRTLQPEEFVLVDAGFEFEGYAADITRTFPSSGRFTELQEKIYATCLKAHEVCISQCLKGNKMEDLHWTAARIILEGLKQARIVQGDIDEMMQANIFALFFPHGLGHFLGLDTHDVGGYPKGVDRIDRPGIQYLRARRTLEPGMVVTIEPGVYFIPALLVPAFENPEQSKFLNVKKLSAMLDFGGVRIEDNIVITETGYENLSSVPKSIASIHSEMKS